MVFYCFISYNENYCLANWAIILHLRLGTNGEGHQQQGNGGHAAEGVSFDVVGFSLHIVNHYYWETSTWVLCPSTCLRYFSVSDLVRLCQAVLVEGGDAAQPVVRASAFLALAAAYQDGGARLHLIHLQRRLDIRFLFHIFFNLHF
jgi:hypothetical protein